MSGLAADLGVVYTSSAVVGDDGAPSAAVVEPTGPSHVGGRAPHVWVDVGGHRASTLELGRERLTLMIGAAGAPWRSAAAHIRRQFMMPLFVVAIDNQGTIDDGDDGWLARFGIDASGAVLIRPDGRIAWRSRSAVVEPEATLAKVLERVLGFASDDAVDAPDTGTDLGGRVYSSSAAIGTIAGPNLTRGRGGIGAELTPVDVARALRRGVRRDGRSLIVMPSEVFTHLSENDLAAIVAYLGQIAPVDRDVPRTRFGPVGRALLALGKLNILVAGKTPHVTAPDSVSRETTPAYGRYLADIAGCRGCHGAELSGGRVAGPPGLPPASNLTTAGIGDWRETNFVRAMRQGRRPDGTALDTFMPWQVFAKMTDAELHAVWLYLRSVPPKAFGNKSTHPFGLFSRRETLPSDRSARPASPAAHSRSARQLRARQTPS